MSETKAEKAEKAKKAAKAASRPNPFDPRRAQTVTNAKPVQPSLPTPKIPPLSQGAPAASLWDGPHNAGKAFKNGVGGSSYFKLCVANRDNNTGKYGFDENNAVIFEMAPARRSFFEKQGQTVPGVGAGMDFTTRANIAKLNVPGARPLYQHMGIAEERIEFVGAFIGFDEYIGDDEGPTWDTGRGDNTDAWEKSQRLAYAVRTGKEMGLFLGWEDRNIHGGTSTNGQPLKEYTTKAFNSGAPDHPIRFRKEETFRGYVHSIVRTYATAQRVYYRVSFIVTNNSDMLKGPSSYGQPVNLPTTLAAFVDYEPSDSASNEGQSENQDNHGQPANQESAAPAAPVSTATPVPPPPPVLPPTPTPEQAQAAARIRNLTSGTDLAKEAANSIAGLNAKDKAELTQLGAQIDKLNNRLISGVSEKDIKDLNSRVEKFYEKNLKDKPQNDAFKKMTEVRDAVENVAKANKFGPAQLPDRAPATATPQALKAPAVPSDFKPMATPRAPQATTPPSKPTLAISTKTTLIAGEALNPALLNSEEAFGKELNNKLQSDLKTFNSIRDKVISNPKSVPGPQFYSFCEYFRKDLESASVSLMQYSYSPSKNKYAQLNGVVTRSHKELSNLYNYYLKMNPVKTF